MLHRQLSARFLSEGRNCVGSENAGKNFKLSGQTLDMELPHFFAIASNH